MKIHRPIQWLGTTTTPKSNPYAWTKAANVVHIDECVGVGFIVGTVANAPNPADTVLATAQWIESFFKQFPELKTKILHFMGENLPVYLCHLLWKPSRERTSACKLHPPQCWKCCLEKSIGLHCCCHKKVPRDTPQLSLYKNVSLSMPEL